MNRRSNDRTRRGAVLILVLGVLIVLTLLGMTFISLQNVEKMVSRGHTDQVRAKLLAMSGYEHAVSQLSDLVQTGFFGSSGASWYTYFGNDVDRSGTLDPNEMNSPNYQYSQTGNPPLEWARSVSWWMPQNATQQPAPNVLSRRVKIEHPQAVGMTTGGPQPLEWGITGALYNGIYGPNTECYALKVADTAGQIYINDGVYQRKTSPCWSNPNVSHSSVSANLKWLINQVGWAAGIATTVRVGDMIVDARDASFPLGFTSKTQVASIIGQANYTKIEPFITTYTWVDPNVVQPVPLSASVYPPQLSTLTGNYPSGYRVVYYRGSQTNPILRYGRTVNYQNAGVSAPMNWYQGGGTGATGTGIYGMDELHPQYVEVVHRAPVNMNSAPQEVLEALIANVEGFFWMERRSNSPTGNAPGNFTLNGYTYGWGSKGITEWGPGSGYVGYTWWYQTQTYDPSTPSNLQLARVSYSGGWENQGTCAYSKPDRDELGDLYKTAQLWGQWQSGGTGGVPGVSARVIAQNIMACRSGGSINTNRADGSAISINYANLPFGGAFKTWAQFFEFLDYLVQNRVIEDRRFNQFWDYNASDATSAWTGANPAGMQMQAYYASQAIADALKSNFCPNLHLNTSNPDSNMFFRVDKVSLVKSSTEFSFTPGGYFEIESLGRVLQPVEGNSTNAFNSAMNRIRGEMKIQTAVRIFDKYRESTQRHFYASLLDSDSTTGLWPRTHGPETNNNMALEMGVEADNGPTVYGDTFNGYNVNTYGPTNDGYLGTNPGSTGWGFEAEGYIRLATTGGPSTTIPTMGAPPFSPIRTNVGQYVATPQGSSFLGDQMHNHFCFDTRCHYHASGDQYRQELAGNGINLTEGAVDSHPLGSSYYDVNANSSGGKIEVYENYRPSSAETMRPPYYPTQQNGRHRMYRSFRLPLLTLVSGTSTGALPTLNAYAMSNMRTDGFYSERHSGLAYWLDWGKNFSDRGSYISIWMKPNWFPERTGRARSVFSMSRYHRKNVGHCGPSPMYLIFFPAHYNDWGANIGNEDSSVTFYGSPSGAGDDTPEEGMGGRNPTFYRPMSLVFDKRYGCWEGYLDDPNHEGPWLEAHYGMNTRTLNHGLDHGQHSPARPNQLEGHRWSLVTLQWMTAFGGTVYSPSHAVHTWVNDWYAGGKSDGGTFFTASGLWSSDHGGGTSEISYFMNHWWKPSGSSQKMTNALRLGAVSSEGVQIQYPSSTPLRYPRNFAADATFDELYMWISEGQAGSSTPPTNVSNLWAKGRYYIPTLNDANDGVFLSAPFTIGGAGSVDRLYPPAGNATPPATTGGTGSGGGTTVSLPPPPPSQRHILGYSWTWFAEDYVTTGSAGSLIPIMYDYRNLPANGMPIAMLQQVPGSTGAPVAAPCVKAYVQVGSTWYPTNPATLSDGYTPIVDASGLPVVITASTPIRYKLWFQIQGVVANTILLESPYFDDITFFYDNGGPELLYLTMVPISAS